MTGGSGTATDRVGHEPRSRAPANEPRGDPHLGACRTLWVTYLLPTPGAQPSGLSRDAEPQEPPRRLRSRLRGNSFGNSRFVRPSLRRTESPHFGTFPMLVEPCFPGLLGSAPAPCPAPELDSQGLERSMAWLIVRLCSADHHDYGLRADLNTPKPTEEYTEAYRARTGDPGAAATGVRGQEATPASGVQSQPWEAVALTTTITSHAEAAIEIKAKRQPANRCPVTHGAAASRRLTGTTPRGKRG